jgi:catechol 2,3-dioxygenase-like lactoylglutathione lyase family enzyme
MPELELGWPNWIGVVARDLEAQRRFYRDVLGLRELRTGDDFVWFDMGDGRLLELLALDPEQPQYDQVRYQSGFTVRDIHAAAREMASRGVSRLTDVEGGPESGQYWCYFRDPEGNVFEITQPLQ